MNAQVDTDVAGSYAGFEPMTLTDLAEVVAIEQTLYSAPWTYGNFRDSLAAHYSAWVLRATAQGAEAGALIGYFLLLGALDEAHLLNLSVRRAMQRRGYGIALLQKAIEVARVHRAKRMILEVRPSNQRALMLYERSGFRQIGLRSHYYPTNEGTGGGREDALVLERSF